MADRKATNKYYPPEYFSEYLAGGGRGGLNAYRGQHPLRERAKRIDEGILRVRFEMPFNIWCGGCGSHIGKGVRYNADKSRAGSYFSTPIWRFRMKCHLCPQWFEIQTDPQARDYAVVSGARRKVEEWDAADSGTVDLTNVGGAEGGGGVDPFEALEKELEQRRRADEGKKRLWRLIDDRKQRFGDDYGSSQLLRRRFRDGKAALRQQRAADDALRARYALSTRLATPHADDALAARAAVHSAAALSSSSSAERRAATLRRERDRARQSIFHTARTPPPPPLLSAAAAAAEVSSRRSSARGRHAAEEKLWAKGVDVSVMRRRERTPLLFSGGSQIGRSAASSKPPLKAESDGGNKAA